MATASVEYALGLQGHSCLIIPDSSRRFVYLGHTLYGHRDFLVQAFEGNISESESLINIAIWLSQQIFHISFDQAREEVEHNIKKRPNIEKSMILANTLGPEEKGREKVLAMLGGRLASLFSRAFPGGRLDSIPSRDTEREVIGYSTQELWPLKTKKGEVDVMYVSTMAVLPEHRRMGLGSTFFSAANSSLEPDVIMLRTRSGAAVAALRKSQLIEGPVFPLDETYDKDPLMRAVLNKTYRRTGYKRAIDRERGIIREFYPDKRDLAYVPDPNHPVASEADKRMEELGLERNNGDAMYVGGKVIGRKLWSQAALTTV